MYKALDSFYLTLVLISFSLARSRRFKNRLVKQGLWDTLENFKWAEYQKFVHCRIFSILQIIL